VLLVALHVVFNEYFIEFGAQIFAVFCRSMTTYDLSKTFDTDFIQEADIINDLSIFPCSNDRLFPFATN